MKTPIFCSGILLLLLSSCGKKSECQKLHTGKFVILSGSGKETTIVRTDSTQTEYSEKTGAGKTMKIRWIDECTYELYEPRDKKTGRKFPMDIRIWSQIYDISENGHFVKVTSNINSREMEFEVKSINPE